MNPAVFVEVGTVLVITLLITSIVRLLNQPAIIGYILSGIAAGPYVLDLISSTDTFTALAQKGVALLLFAVGIGMNPKVIREVGKISLITGIGQVLFTSIVGYFIALYMGFSNITSIFIAIALTFSSTIVIMKLISDRNDTEKLYAKISVGFLIVQDFIVILLLLIISTLKQGTSLSTIFIDIAVKGFVSIFVLFLISAYVLPKVMHLIAKSAEILFLFSLTWCFSIASLFHILNFSIEAGALIAGMALSMSPYQFEIKSRMKPLRDFFLILFFVMLGSQMVFTNIFENWIPILVFSFFVLIGNPIIVMILMGSLGYTKKTSFKSGLTVAQISEFSLILVSLGISMGYLQNNVLSIMTAIALITFAGSTYMITNSDKIFNLLSPYLSVFEKREHKKIRIKKSEEPEILILGYNNLAKNVTNTLRKIKKDFMVVDHDPIKINELSCLNIKHKYGDASNAEFMSNLKLKNKKLVISTIADLNTNLSILDKIGTKTIMTVVSKDNKEAIELYNKGASYVITPHLLSAQHLTKMLGKNKLARTKFQQDRKVHLNKLK